MIRLVVPALIVLASISPPVFSASPNVVIIFADDLGYGDLGSYGQKKWKTPHLDQLARDGVRFTDFYVAQAVCSASRAALLTGCYPNRIGIQGALGPSARHGINSREMLISEMLKSKGYATACFGKWHLGHHPQFLPTQHGFDEYYGLPYSNDMWPNHPTSKFPDLPLIEGGTTIEVNPDQRKLTTQYTTRAIDFITRNKARSFFLYLPHAMPHVPLFVSEKHQGKSGAGLYGDVIEEIDWSVGQIRATLKQQGLADNTLVMFISDNGPWLSYGNHAGSAGPFREGKGTTFEGGVRVPFLAAWPGVIPPGTVCKEPAMTIDVLPTIAEFTSAKLGPLPIDGKSIRSLLEGKTDAKSPHEALYFYWGLELQAIRSGPWKMHLPHTYNKPTPGADGKPGKQTGMKIDRSLYNLEKDVAEGHDVLAENPDVVARLEKLAQQTRQVLGDSSTKTPGEGIRPAGQIPAVKQVLLIGQGPDGAHAPGTHEYAAGMRILAACLRDVPGLKVEVLHVVAPWKEGPELMARADGVVLYVAEGARWLDGDPKRREALAQVAKRGGGIGVLHWGMGTKDAASIPTALDLFGGCHGGPDRKYQILETELKPTAQGHPILRGIGSVRVKEEFYYALKFAQQGKVIPLAQAKIDGKNETVAWAWERPDGGRSFGFTGLHYHENWQKVEYRRLVAQGVLWSMNQEIPEKGLPVVVTADELKP